MLDPRWLAALAAVVETGSFEKAGQRLFITQSAISQRIKQLEETLGQAVVARTTPIAPTAAGHRLLRHYRQLAAMESELMASLQASDEPERYTTLAIGINADSLGSWVLEALTPLLSQRRLLLDIVLDDQDYTYELMREGHVIGCVSARAHPMQGGECQYLGKMRYRCLGTPDFAARHFPDGVDAAALALAPAIVFNQKDDLHAEFLARHFDFHDDFPRFTLPSPHGFIELTEAALAYSLLPEIMLGDAEAAGRLVDLCPGLFVDLPLYWHHWRVESPLARALGEQLVGYCAARLR